MFLDKSAIKVCHVGPPKGKSEKISGIQSLFEILPHMKSALILEGGGMRGVFTCGALDCLLDNKLYFPYVAGTSAGASNGLSYASRQRGRARACNIDELLKRNYIGLRFMLTQGCIMDYKYLFGDLPRKVRPYDFSAYLKSGRYILTATNCLTGKPEYFDSPKTFDDLLICCKASCSLPYLCKMVFINGVPYVDGGISDAVPQKKAERDGFKNNLVILTRNKGYRKSGQYLWPAKFFYGKYPELVRQLGRAHIDYNENISYIEHLEARGEITVIRPEEPLVVDRLQTDPEKLQQLYEQGYNAAKKLLKQIKSKHF